MNIENDIFKKSIIVPKKLVAYGFKKEKGMYTISKKIHNNNFQVNIEITDDGIVNGKIIDLTINEEYTSFRIQNHTGEFVNKIREEFIAVLNDIRDNCTIQNHFMTKQANRITNWIINQYNDLPTFLWSKFPGYGVFKTSRNDKWYAIIMNINKNKITKGNEEVEILNVKLDEKEIKDLLKRKGFYPAYHMNKNNWLTIILDDTLSDEEIISYIVKSHQFTEEINEWIVPANPKYYDIINCFNDTDTIIWNQSTNIHVGDIIYLYAARPYSAILYQCEVLEVNIPYEYHDQNVSMSKVMKIKLLKKYTEDQFTFDFLKKHGITMIRGSRTIPKALSKELNK